MAANDLCTLDDVKDWLGLQDRTITAISKANPGIVTCPSHNFRNGARLYFSNIVGMVELNGQTVRITVVDANSFSIGVDTRTHTTFVSGFIGPDDNLLQKLITRASEDIRSETNREFYSAERTEVRSGVGWGQRLFIPKEAPITDVTSVTIDGIAVPLTPDGSPEGTAGFGFTADHIYLVGYEFTEGTNNIEVVYEGGFETYPEDLIGACVELTAYRYKSKDRIGESSKGLAGQSTSYVTDHIPKSIKLQRFKRVVPV